MTRFWERIKHRIRTRRTRIGKHTEADVPLDDSHAGTRATGRRHNHRENQTPTTETTPDDTFVGRVAGDDVGYAGKTGAELRAERARPARDHRDGSND